MRDRTSSPLVQRFDWKEMRRYWEMHQDVRARTDLQADPYALGNVCLTGAPAWLNEHYAAGQKVVFDRLLSLVPNGGRALDVGCGGARWSEQLSELGWEVTGIDLQEALIENNRRRLPHIRFERVALQDFQPDAPFSLVCSVTVLGHIPHEEQPAALARLNSITLSGSRVLALKNVRDQGTHVFANSVEEWTRRFADARFAREAVLPYDFNPCIRALTRIRQLAEQVVRRSAAAAAVHPDAYKHTDDSQVSGLRTACKRAYRGLMRLAADFDRRLDPWLTARSSSILPAAHAGMLFVRI